MSQRRNLEGGVGGFIRDNETANGKQKTFFFSFTKQMTYLLSCMLSVSHAPPSRPFSGLRFRLAPKCLLAPNVCILKSAFRHASCSALDRDSLQWTSAVGPCLK